MKYGFLRSLLFALTILSMVVFVPVQSASADKPDRDPLPGGSFLITDACEFDVFFEELTNRSFITTFYDRDGNPTRMLVTGSLKGTLTNLSNNQSMDVNISGPANIALNEDGTSTYYSGGTWLVYLFPTDAPAFQPRLFLHSGRMVLEINDEGITSVRIVGGRTVDLCAALSD